MSNHTPGPWSVSGIRHKGDLKIGDQARLHMVGTDVEKVCAVFFDMETGLGWNDARLIASAPCLITALEAAATALTPEQCEQLGITAALAKARGE